MGGRRPGPRARRVRSGIRGGALTARTRAGRACGAAPYSSRAAERAVFLLGTIGCVFAPDLGVLLVARFVLGLAVGAASQAVPIYLSEMAPEEGRGSLGGRNELAIVLGQMVEAEAKTGGWTDLGTPWIRRLVIVGACLGITQ